MTETVVILDFDIKGETLRNVQKKIKIGTKGKKKLNNLRKLLERNSEQLKQKITEYFQKQRKILDEREAKLLNKVNVFIDCRITEIDGKLKHFQEKLDHLRSYQLCLEDELPLDYSIYDDFDCFVAASRYNFCAENNYCRSCHKKFGALKQVDVLIARLDSSDEDDSDDDVDLCKDNTLFDAFMKKCSALSKNSETELSDAASSCSVISYKEIGEEIEEDKNKTGKDDCLDDYEFLALEVPSQPAVQDEKTFSTNLSSSDNIISETISAFKEQMQIEKNAQSNNVSTIYKDTDKTAAGENTCEIFSLADKVVDSMKAHLLRNEQKDCSGKVHCEIKNFSIPANKNEPNHDLKRNSSALVRTKKSIDYISNFNSRVQMILDKHDPKMEVDIC